MLGTNAPSNTKKNTREDHKCCMYKEERPVDTKASTSARLISVEMQAQKATRRHENVSSKLTANANK